MEIKKTIIPIIAFLALALSAVAQEKVADRNQWMNELRQYKRTYFAKELDLTREQQNKFFPLYEEMEQQTAAVDDDVRLMERRIAEAPDASDLEYEKAAEAIYDGKVRQAEIEKSYMEKFKDVLSRKQLFMLNSVERQFQRDIIKQHQRLRSRKAVADASRE